MFHFNPSYDHWWVCYVRISYVKHGGAPGAVGDVAAVYSRLWVCYVSISYVKPIVIAAVDDVAAVGISHDAGRSRQQGANVRPQLKHFKPALTRPSRAHVKRSLSHPG